MVLSSEFPNLISLNTESLTRFLEQCQQKGLREDQILLQITDDIRNFINTKLKNNPIQFNSQLQNNDWENQIPIVDLLQHCKTMVIYEKQTNDAIIQTALKKIRFDIDLSVESSIDRISAILL